MSKKVGNRVKGLISFFPKTAEAMNGKLKEKIFQFSPNLEPFNGNVCSYAYYICVCM